MKVENAFFDAVDGIVHVEQRYILYGARKGRPAGAARHGYKPGFLQPAERAPDNDGIDVYA